MFLCVEIDKLILKCCMEMQRAFFCWGHLWTGSERIQASSLWSMGSICVLFALKGASPTQQPLLPPHHSREPASLLPLRFFSCELGIPVHSVLQRGCFPTFPSGPRKATDRHESHLEGGRHLSQDSR